MTDEIRFEEDRDSLLYSRFERSAQVPTMVQWMISKGIVKNTETARYVLLAFCVACVVLSFVVPAFIGPSSPHIKPMSEEMLREMSQQ